jgi:hypothetical protein
MAVALAPSTAQVNALTAWVDATFAMSRNVTIRAANLAAFSAVTPAPLRLPYVEVPGGPVAAGAQPGVGRGLGQVPTIMSDELYGVSTGVVNAYAAVYLHPNWLAERCSNDGVPSRASCFVGTESEYDCIVRDFSLDFCVYFIMSISFSNFNRK